MSRRRHPQWICLEQSETGGDKREMGRGQIFEHIITVCSQRMGSQTFRRVRTERGISGSSERGSIMRRSIRKHGVFGGIC